MVKNGDSWSTWDEISPESGEEYTGTLSAASEATSKTFKVSIHINGGWVDSNEFTVTWKEASTGHIHSYSAVVTAPTCTEKGYTTHTCACGDNYVDTYVDAMGHTEVTVPGKAATCTEDGLTDGKKCSVCDTVTVAQETIAAKGHTWGEWVTTKEATKTETGTKERTCSVCDDKERDVIPVLFPSAPVKYTISYDLNGGTMDGKTGIVTVDIEEGTVITLPTPSREGYAFDYWEGSKYYAGDSYTVTEDHTFTAQWKEVEPSNPTKPTEYTVTFNMNGHGTQVPAQTVEKGNKATKPADPTASGYTFDGWYADATFSAKFDFDSEIKANTTVYAKWTEVKKDEPTKPADPTNPTQPTKPADPTSPQTGDNSHLFLWVALLFISGGALVGTAVYGKKRKYNAK